MFSKIFTLSALLAAVNAAYPGHGHAVSFQSIVHHNQPTSAHYATPVAHYNVPVVHYATPVAHYAAPVAHYAASRANYDGHNTYERPNYNYAYDSRDTNAPHGHYSLVQSNGSFRKEYTANLNGLNAALRNAARPLHPAPIYEEDEQLY